MTEQLFSLLGLTYILSLGFGDKPMVLFLRIDFV